MRLVIVVSGENLLRRCWRRMCGIAHEGDRGQRLEAVAGQRRDTGEALLRAGSRANEHVGAVIGIGGDIAAAFVVGADIGIVPDAAMRIVVLRRCREAVEPPAAGDRVFRLGNIDAHLRRGRSAAHFEQEPAIGEPIEEDNRIADRGGAAIAARRERLERGRAGQLGAGLVVDGEGCSAAAIDAVDDVVGADVDHRIAGRDAGRSIVDADTGLRGAPQSQRRGVVVPHLLQLGQAVGRGLQPAWCGAVYVLGRKELALVCFLDGHARAPAGGRGQVAQVNIDADGADRFADLHAVRGGGFKRVCCGRWQCQQQTQQDYRNSAILELHREILMRLLDRWILRRHRRCLDDDGQG